MKKYIAPEMTIQDFSKDVIVTSACTSYYNSHQGTYYA